MKAVSTLAISCITLGTLIAIPSSGLAHDKTEPTHSGGTDKCGCHYNRKTGEYHCHKRKQRGGDCPP